MPLKTCATRTLNDHSLRERASVIMCWLRIQPELPPSELISAWSHFISQSFHYLVEHLTLNACQFVKVDCLTCPVNAGTEKAVGLGGFGTFGVRCTTHWQCKGFLVGLLESILASQCLWQFCALRFAKHRTAKGRISGISKVGINCFQGKDDEWIHVIETDFPHFIVLKTFQRSDESWGKNIFLISKLWIV